IAVRETALTMRLLNEALSLQERLRAIGGEAPPLGHILRDLDLLTPEEVEWVKQAQLGADPPDDDRLGVLAVLNNFSTRERVERIAERQAAEGKLLGELLVETGDLSPQALRALLGAQARLRGAPTDSGVIVLGEEWDPIPGGYKVGEEMLVMEQIADPPTDLEQVPWWVILLLGAGLAMLGAAAAIVFLG
ncbi:MAG: hypothetical protein ACYTGX_06540, partial [Planctomycetota bacterium]